MDEFQAMPNFNEGRSDAGCCYHNKKLIVAGGYVGGQPRLQRGRDNSPNGIEMLNITASDNDSQWVKSESVLPRRLVGHSLTSFKRKIILIGGERRVGSEGGNEVWDGTMKRYRIVPSKVSNKGGSLIPLVLIFFIGS